MTARPCIRCGGVFATGSHCTDCRPKDNRTNREHVAWRNNAQWKDLSKRLRRTSPFCEWCGATEQLTVDHILPVSDYEELAYAVENCRVLCKACNGRRGHTFTLDEAEAVLKRLEATQRRQPTKISPRTRQRRPQSRTGHQGGCP